MCHKNLTLFFLIEVVNLYLSIRILFQNKIQELKNYTKNQYINKNKLMNIYYWT